MRYKAKALGKTFGIFALLYIAGMLAVYAFMLMNITTLIGFPVFILGILVMSIESDSGIWGAVLGVFYLVSYDLLFTTPTFGLAVFGRTDLIALVIFIVVSLIMNSLTQRMRAQVEIAERDAAVMGLLNKVSTGLIDSTSPEGACQCAARFLKKTFDREVTVTYGDPGPENELARECYEHDYRTGFGEAGSRESKVKYLPLSSKEGTYGVVAVDCSEGDLDTTGRSFLNSVITQTAIAIERNELERTRRETQIEIEHERFRATLLRSVSHDLRTPLTSISGNVDYLLWNEEADEKTKKELLEAISDDAKWLGGMVDNLLSMTRVQDPSLPLLKSPEIVDDIVGGAVEKEHRRLGEHQIAAHVPEDILIVPMDGRLISQVLVNLIDNALKHTRPDSKIEVSAWAGGDLAHFAVADDGGGIGAGELDKIFGRFYTTDDSHEGRRGMGLGLSICKAIVEAHGGTISARNNEQGGATFEFTLPLQEDGE